MKNDTTTVYCYSKGVYVNIGVERSSEALHLDIFGDISDFFGPPLPFRVLTVLQQCT